MNSKTFAPLSLRRLTLASAALTLPACAGQSAAQKRAEELARTRPPHVRVVAKYAAGTARTEGCHVEFATQAPAAAQSMRKLADLELTGNKLDRAQAEKLLGEKACALGVDTLVISEERYGSEQERGRVEATAYGFHSPVQILPSGMDMAVAPKPLSCRVLYFRTQRPELAYDELAGLQLNIPVPPGFIAVAPTNTQERALNDLRQAACHLGADAIVISEERYDVPMLGTRVAGTAILFRESRQRRPTPGSTEL
jgi:hypothetical protein